MGLIFFLFLLLFSIFVYVNEFTGAGALYAPACSCEKQEGYRPTHINIVLSAFEIVFYSVKLQQRGQAMTAEESTGC